MRTLVLALVLVGALGGCASRSYQASPRNFSLEAEWARNDGRWHQAIDPYAVCEIRS